MVGENESIKSDKESVLVLGSGPSVKKHRSGVDSTTCVPQLKAIQAAGY